MPSDMRKSIRQAALLRNLIETCLKAAASPMTGRELAEWPSISEQLGTGAAGYGKLSYQLQAMTRRGLLGKIGGGPMTTYTWQGTAAASSAPSLPADLRLRVDREARTLSFSFLGLNITIEVAK